MPLREVLCVTGNAGKWQIFQNTVGDLLDLRQAPLETPEIQALDVREVALFSAKWAAKELGKPVLKTDVGYYVNGLGGFPGPFVKWTNQTLTPENILAMLGDTAERGITIRDALAYAEPDGFGQVMTVERRGVIMKEIYPVEGPWKSIFDRIVLEEGQAQCFAATSFDDQMAYLGRIYREPYRAFVASLR